MHLPTPPADSAHPGEWYRFLEEVLRYAIFVSARELLDEPAATPTVLGELHNTLLDDAMTWGTVFSDLKILGDSHSGASDKKRQLGELVTLPPQDERTLAEPVLTAAWRFVDRLVISINKHVVLQSAGRLHGFVEGEVVRSYKELRDDTKRIQVVSDALVTALADVAEILTVARAEAGSESELGDLDRAAKYCSVADTRRSLLAGLYTADRSGAADKLPNSEVSRAWSFARVVEAVCRDIFEQDVRCDIYRASPNGDLLVFASSDQFFPGPPPKPFASRLVPSAQFLGGAALATDSVLPNDHPDTLTNTNHREEGEPERTLAVPIRLGEKNAGALFISASRPAPTWAAMHPMSLALVATAAALSTESAGLSDNGKWRSVVAGFRSTKEFDVRLAEEARRATKLGGSSRLAIIVVASTPASPRSRERTSVSHLRDNWAKFTALRRARGETVYQLKRSAYAIVKPELTEDQWQELRDTRLRLVRALRADGQPGGHLGEWIVPWRGDLLEAAVAQEGEEELKALARGQVFFSASEIVALNEIQWHIARGGYARAYWLAKLLVDTKDEGRQCGVAIHELTRMALTIAQFHAAQRYSFNRKKEANWDIEVHLNYVLACVALGDLKSAEDELMRCPMCKDFRPAGPPADEPPAGNIYAMFDFAKALVPWLRKPTSEPLLAELKLATSKIAGDSPYNQSVDTALTAIAIEYGRRTKDIPALQRKLEDEVDPFLRADLNEAGELPYWSEMAALRRLLSVLRGYLFQEAGGSAKRR